ncbi:MAG: hypothetical protein IKK28_03890 [Mogibacterium sp.]|nr:hypothetical protein [Mogibacterium sp.]
MNTNGVGRVEEYLPEEAVDLGIFQHHTLESNHVSGEVSVEDSGVFVPVQHHQRFARGVSAVALGGKQFECFA